MKQILTVFCILLATFILSGCFARSSTVASTEITQHKSEMPTSDDMPAGIVSVKTYGAAGDGVTDDTKAIQSAISSGDTLYFPAGSYKLSKSIKITDKRLWSLYAQDAHFIYEGDDYAFRINAAENCVIEIGEISSEHGGGIAFYSKDPHNWNQYVRLTFNYISCLTDCIYIEASAGWCNENQIYGGRFAGGENGVKINYLGHDILNGWNFYNCGIEGVNNGFLIDAGRGYISGISVINARYAESFQTILKTSGSVRDCLWIGTHEIDPQDISCSSKTNRFEIIAPIGETGHRGSIINGKLMVEKITYEEAGS